MTSFLVSEFGVPGGIALLAIVVLLALSKRSRAVLGETIKHPFRPAVMMHVAGDEIRVVENSNDSRKTPAPA